MALSTAAGRGQHAGAVADVAGYKPSTVSSAYRTNADGNDEADLAAGNTAVDEINCQGFTTVAVCGHHSAASSTCVIHFVRFYKTGSTLTPKSMSTATLTGNATFRDAVAGDYLSLNSVYFDTEGCALAKVIIEDPSSGSVDLFVEVN